MTPQLAASVKSVAGRRRELCCFSVQRRDFFMDNMAEARAELARTTCGFFGRRKCATRGSSNPYRSRRTGGSVAGYLDHFPFSQRNRSLVRRHNSYSTLEARPDCAESPRPGAFRCTRHSLQRISTCGVSSEGTLFRTPFRPLFVKFCFYISTKRGFLDGRAGFQYAILQAIYEHMIVLKVRESQGKS